MASLLPSTWICREHITQECYTLEFWVWSTLTHHVGPLAFGFPAEKGEIISFQPSGGECNTEESGRSRFILASGLGCDSVSLYKAWDAFSGTTKQTTKPLA